MCHETFLIKRWGIREAIKKRKKVWNLTYYAGWKAIFQKILFFSFLVLSIALKWSTCSETWNKQIFILSIMTCTQTNWPTCTSGDPDCLLKKKTSTKSYIDAYYNAWKFAFFENLCRKLQSCKVSGLQSCAEFITYIAKYL